jgi:hypothetical protein
MLAVMVGWYVIRVLREHSFAPQPQSQRDANLSDFVFHVVAHIVWQFTFS